MRTDLGCLPPRPTKTSSKLTTSRRQPSTRQSPRTLCPATSATKTPSDVLTLAPPGRQPCLVCTFTVHGAPACQTWFECPVPLAAKWLTFLCVVEAQAFDGPAPETINGRLAMLGITSALAAEFATGVGLREQWLKAPAPILFSFAIIAIASYVPILKGFTRCACLPN